MASETRNVLNIMTGLVLGLMCAGSVVQGIPSNNCYDQVLGHSQLDTSHCTLTMRHRESFLDMSVLLQDAYKREEEPDSETKAIMILFYNYTTSDLPPGNSGWWQIARRITNSSLTRPVRMQNNNNNNRQATNVLIGRRKRTAHHADTLSDNEDMLYGILDFMARDTHVACIQYFIGRFKQRATHIWHIQHPNSPPSPPAPTTTTTKKTTTPTPPTTTTITTAATSTTTTIPTTPSTFTTSTTTTTTVAPTTSTKPTTTATISTTTISTTSQSQLTAASCMQCGNLTTGQACSDLDLILSVPRKCPVDKPYCMTDFVQTNGAVKFFKRCVDTLRCLVDWYEGSSDKPQCYEFDPVIYPGDLSCHLCCQGDNCNKDVLPPKDTLFKP